VRVTGTEWWFQARIPLLRVGVSTPFCWVLPPTQNSIDEAKPG